MCHLKYRVPKEISIVIHNRSKYDYGFIINKIAEECEEEFTWLEKSTDKLFSVPVKKEVTIIHKKGKEITKKLYLTG